MPRKYATLEPMPVYPEKPTVVSVLRGSTLLNTVTDDDLVALSRVSHLAFADRGEILWLHGNQVEFIGIAGVGFIKMVKPTPGGTELTHEIMGPGQVFGMLGMLDGTGCPLSARAVTPLWYLKVPKREFQPIYERTPALKDHVIRRTTLRLRHVHEMLARLSTGTVGSRIATILLTLAESYGLESKEGVTIRVPLTRQDIAEMAGTTVESTIRVMSKWQKAGLICTQSRLITILDSAQIEAEVRA